jgi:Uma2 family endonuclease
MNPRTKPVSPVLAPGEQHFVLSGVSWQMYARLLRAFARRPGIRLTYDHGVLELMTLSHEHESQVSLLRRLVEAYTEELSLPLKSGRSTTWRRRRKQRGLGADECYWIAHEPLVRSKDVIDLRRDPPPDLALEIDVSSSSVERLPIYAALRVPEVWLLAADTLTFLVLDAQGQYSLASHSRSFPQLRPADLLPYLALRGQLDENTILRQFRAWVRQHVLSSGLPPQGT